MATVASSSAVIDSRMPATGEGISVSTLSVDTSTSGSSTATESPTFFNQRVTVPSVTDSPNVGISTGVASPAGCADGAGAGGVGAGCWGSAGAGAAAAGAGVAAGAAAGAAASPASPITASSPPTATVSSSWATIFVRTPDAGEGISVSTLSVDTSSSGSSSWTVSPSCLSQRVTVPSVTLSPSAGIWTDTAMCTPSNVVLITDCGASAQPYHKGLPQGRCSHPVIGWRVPRNQVRYQSKRAGS